MQFGLTKNNRHIWYLLEIAYVCMQLYGGSCMYSSDHCHDCFFWKGQSIEHTIPCRHVFKKKMPMQQCLRVMQLKTGLFVQLPLLESRHLKK